MYSHTLQTIQYDSVADLYDEYVQTDLDLPFWLKECRSVKGEVLELMSGTGRVSIPLLKAGVKLTCADYAPGMLAQLEKKLHANGLSCRTECQDVAELDLDAQYHLIFIPFHSFSEIVDPEKRRQALRRIRDHLTDSGTFICSLQNPIVRTLTMDGRERRIGEFSISGEESLVVDSTLLFDPVSQMATGTQTYDRRDNNGNLIERRELPIAFYLFGRGEFEALAKESGFVVQTLYGDYAWAPYEENSSPYMIWKLSKSATTVNSQDPKLIALLFNESINSHDVDGLAALMTEDHTFIDREQKTGHPKDVMVRGWRDFFEAFPKYKNTFTRVQSRDDLVIILGWAYWSEEQPYDPVIWTAKIVGDLVREWRVYADTETNRRVFNLL